MGDRRQQTAEELVDEMLAEMLTPESDTFEMMIPSFDERNGMDSIPKPAPAEAAKLAKLDRIRQGDKRLVRSEPMACNVALPDSTIGPATESAKEAGMSRNMLINLLVEHGIAELGAGRIKFTETQMA